MSLAQWKGEFWHSSDTVQWGEQTADFLPGRASGPSDHCSPTSLYFLYANTFIEPQR